MIATYSIFHIFYFDSSKPGFCLIETVLSLHSGYFKRIRKKRKLRNTSLPFNT